MIDLGPFPPAHESPDVQTALSHKYIGRTFCIVPLEFPRFALFSVRGHERTLLAISDDPTAVLEWITENFWEHHRRAKETEERLSRPRESIPELSLDLLADLASELKI